MELKLQGRTKRKRRSHHLTSRTVQGLYVKSENNNIMHFLSLLKPCKIFSTSSREVKMYFWKGGSLLLQWWSMESISLILK